MILPYIVLREEKYVSISFPERNINHIIIHLYYTFYLIKQEEKHPCSSLQKISMNFIHDAVLNILKQIITLFYF